MKKFWNLIKAVVVGFHGYIVSHAQGMGENWVESLLVHIDAIKETTACTTILGPMAILESIDEELILYLWKGRAKSMSTVRGPPQQIIFKRVWLSCFHASGSVLLAATRGEGRRG